LTLKTYNIIILGMSIASVEASNTPFRDPYNGFDGIFSLNAGRLEYTLVKVPANDAFVMEYERGLNQVDLALEPVGGESTDWAVTGVLDTNHYEYLGFPIARARRIAVNEKEWGEGGPTILPGNLTLVRKYGEIENLGHSETAGTNLYRVSLTLPPAKIEAFFNKIWVPDTPLIPTPTEQDPDALSIIEIPVPKFIVGDNVGQDRILPQKYPVRPSTAPMTRLVIFRG
jgi:hypothetical protein